MSGKIHPENKVPSKPLEAASTDSEETRLSISEVQNRKISTLREKILNQGFSEEFAEQMGKVQIKEWEIQKSNAEEKETKTGINNERKTNIILLNRPETPIEKFTEERVNFFIRNKNFQRLDENRSRRLNGRIIQPIRYIKKKISKNNKIHPIESD